jgi:hypothetical protein
MIDMVYRRFGFIPTRVIFFPEALPAIDGCHFVQLMSYNILPFNTLPFYNESNYWSSRTVHIDLTQDLDNIFGKIRKKRRYIIRRGLSMGYNMYSKPPTPSLLKQFRSIYNRTIAKRTEGQFIINLDFYKAIINNMTTFIGEYDGHLLEIMFVIHDSEKAWCYKIVRPETDLSPEIKYYLGSTLQWEVLNQLKNKGCKLFDFGGVVLNPSHDFHDFSMYKMSFGGELADMHRYYGATSRMGSLAGSFRNKIQQFIHGRPN